MFPRKAIPALVAIGMLTAADAAVAQIAVSANDNKMKLNDGKVEVVKSPPADTISVIDLGANPPKLMSEIEVPNSVQGPPLNVAITPKQEIALISSNAKLDPGDPTKTVPDDKVTVVDLTTLSASLTSRLKTAVGLAKNAPPPAATVLATLQVGKGAAGIAMNRAGTLALVANRAEGTVSVLTISGKTVTVGEKIKVGSETSGPSGIAINPEGTMALVTLDNEHKIVVLSIEGTTVKLTDRVISAGLRPYAIDIAKTGDVAIVGNIGLGAGDADTISVIDIKATPPRVVNTISVGQTPEGVKISPDGKYVAVTVMNGSNKAASSPFFNANGKLQVWSRTGTQLTKSGELTIGRWCQGIAWKGDNRTLLVQCMAEEEINVVRFTGGVGNSLAKVGAIKTKGGPAGIRTAEP